MRFLGKLRHLEGVISQETGKGSSKKIVSLCSSDYKGYFPEQMQSTNPREQLFLSKRSKFLNMHPEYVFLLKEQINGPTIIAGGLKLYFQQ